MKVLVTGGGGFIGSWLVESLLAVGQEFTVIDILSTQIHGAWLAAKPDWLDHPAIQFIRADIRDTAFLDRALTDMDAVVHLAAETGTGQSMYEIQHYFSVNVQATAALFELIGRKHRQVRKIILASSRSVYGEGAYGLGGEIVVPSPRSAQQLDAQAWEPKGPAGEALQLIATPEDVLPRPASMYAVTKLVNEQMGSVFADAYGTAVVALRFQNVYGERQSLRNPYTGILSIFSNRMRKHLPINIFEDGKESRDFVHVSDVVKAVTLALHADKSGYTCLNIGYGRPTTVLEVAGHLRAMLNSRSELELTGDYRVGDIRHCYADLTKARDVLGFVPSVSLEQGLGRFTDWVLTQPVLEDRSAAAQKELANQGLGRGGA
jgi:dTDP-L-rhamnose 4-epimerase